MSIVDFITFLKEQNINVPVYPLAFPANSPTEALIVEVSQGANSRGSVYDTTLSITVRSAHPSQGESVSQMIIDKLNLLTDQTVGDFQIILIKSQQLLPQYLGKDAEGNHFFINNFKVLIS